MHANFKAFEEPLTLPAFSNRERSLAGHAGVPDDKLEIGVSNLLLQLGIPVNMKGYRYLKEAVILKIKRRQEEMPATKVLYPEIAKQYSTSAACVETAIRHAIEAAWDRTEPEYRQQMFARLSTRSERRPANSKFIGMAADYILKVYWPGSP